MALMTIKKFETVLSTFKKDLEQSGDVAGYAVATSRLMSEFYADCLKKEQPELIQEIIAFVTSL